MKARSARGRRREQHIRNGAANRAGGLRVARAGWSDVADLALIDVMEGLSQEDIRAMGWKRLFFEVGKGETVYRPTDPSDTLLFLCRGSVRISRRNSDGRRFTLNVIESGTVFGEGCLSGQRSRGSYAEAIERCEVSSMRREDAESMCLENPRVGLRLARLMSERMSFYEAKMDALLFKEVPARLAFIVGRLIEQQGIRASGEYRLPVRYTHEDLAAMIGSTRSSTSRAVTILRERGVIETRGKHICVRDLALLQSAAHDDFHRPGAPAQTPEAG